MMKSFVIAFAVLLAVQSAVAKPKGKQQQQQPAEKSTLEQLTENTRTLVQNVTAFLDSKDLPNSKKIVDAFNENSQKVATHVDSFVNFLKNEWKSHQGDVDDSIKQIEAKLKETSASFQKSVGPDVTAKANEIKTNWDNNLKKTIAQIEQLRKAVEPDVTQAKKTLEDAAKNFLNQISDASKSLETQVKAGVNEHQATHKH